MKMKILLQEPFIEKRLTFGKFAQGSGNNTFPYGLATMSQYLKENGFKVTYLEPSIEGMDIEGYQDYIKSNEFDIVGIGSTTIEIEKTLKTFALAKQFNPSIVTVLGGIHGTLLPEETLERTDAIDYIVMGEGEKPFLNLLNSLKKNNLNEIKQIKGIAFKNNGRVYCNLPDYADMLKSKEIPNPAYDLFPMDKYVSQITFTKRYPSFTVMASRGCPYNCAFCNANQIFGRTVRYKSVKQVINEIQDLKYKYGARGVMFLDSTFTLDKSWVEDFCCEYMQTDINLPFACNSRTDTIDANMLYWLKEAGCWEISFGVESGNQKSLDLLEKGTTIKQNTQALKLTMKEGIYAYANYIICLPKETEQDVLNTINYAKKMGTPLVTFHLPIPFPKTKLWDICMKNGGINKNLSYESFSSWGANELVYINPLIKEQRMKELLKYAYKSYYSNPKILWKNFKEILLLKQDFKKYWMGLQALYGFKGYS